MSYDQTEAEINTLVGAVAGLVAERPEVIMVQRDLLPGRVNAGLYMAAPDYEFFLVGRKIEEATDD